MINFCNLIILLTALLMNTAFAQNKILIVNSNNTIQRYEKIASEFKTTLQKNAYQLVEFNLNTHSDLEAELKQVIETENPQIIYCIGKNAYLLAKEYAKEKMLLFSATINWRRLNISNNTYGISNELSPEQEMSLLRFIFPRIKKIGLLYTTFNQEYVETVKKDAAALNIEMIAQEIDSTEEIEAALNELLPKVDLFWVISDPKVLEDKEAVEQIFQTAKKQKKPVYAYNDVFTKYGAVLTVSTDTGTIGRQSANFVRILEQNKTAAGTVQLPAGSTITLNMCTVESLAMSYSRDAFDSINRIIGCNEE